MRGGKPTAFSIILLIVFAVGAVAQPEIQIEKLTNGQDADLPPGPVLPIGSPVTWTYIVTNLGGRDLTDVSVTDDQGVSVACPGTTLGAGESMVCTGSGTAQAGQYTNLGTVTARQVDGTTISSSDPSHYFGQAQAAVTIEKRTNGFDADLPPGPGLPVGGAVSWTYIITNISAVPLDNISVTDDQGVTVTCPATTLAAGGSMTCTASGTAVAGQYANVGTVTATDSNLAQVVASDPSHYFGQSVDLDFGDAGSPHPTTFAANGARHLLGSGVYLGACVDSEADGQPSAGGDDTGAGLNTFGACATPGDDEDGVTFTSTLIAGSNANLDVVASAGCTLSAWIDFNADGDWSDPGEDLFPGGAALVAGSNPEVIAVPAGAVGGVTGARFRCTTDGAVTPVGPASDGEVEDYAVTLVQPTPALTATKTALLTVDLDNDGLADPGEALTYTITLVNNGSGAATGVTFTDTPDPNTLLVVGSVTTAAGTVTTGNTAGDTSVSVAVGTLAAGGGSATLTFEVKIKDPLAFGTRQVSNQGQVSGANFTSLVTDDPVPPGGGDPTVVPVGAASPAEIPSLNAWGLLALALLLSGLGLRRILAG